MNPNKAPIVKRLSQLPTSVCGLALGIASLGWCWESATLLGGADLNGNGQLFSAIVAAALLLAVVVKFCLQPSLLKQDLQHPVTGGVLPTFSMTLMIVSNSIGQFNHWLGNTVWLIALMIHLGLLVAFIYYRRRGLTLDQMLPNWFVPPVGMIVADVSFSGSPVLAPIADGVLIFGISAYLVLLPLMIYRLIFGANISDAAKPTLAILAAPPNLCLAGYLTITAQPSPIIVAVLAALALLMTTVVYVALLRLLRLSFIPAFSAFTFPLVIGATAMFKTADWLLSINVQFHDVVLYLAYLELIIATLMVGYVAVRYVFLIARSPLNIKVNLRSI